MKPLNVTLPTMGPTQLEQGPAVTPKERTKIRQVSEQFESVFLNLVLKSMRDTVQSSGLVDGGNAEEIYRSMLDNEYSQSMAEQRQTGIADAIEKFIVGSLPKGNQGPQGLQGIEKQVTIDGVSGTIPPKVGTIYGNKTR